MTQPTYPQPAQPQPPQGKPGYYPDNEGAMRWWTGAGWTDHMMGQTAVAQPPQAPKKKRGFLKWIPIALLLVVASCGALIVAGSEDTAPTSASMASDSTEPGTDTDTDQPETFEVGEEQPMMTISSP